jgi:hypothetical protein
MSVLQVIICVLQAMLILTTRYVGKVEPSFKHLVFMLDLCRAQANICVA